MSCENCHSCNYCAGCAGSKQSDALNPLEYALLDIFSVTPLYGRAASCFEAEEKTECYEYAALLNNRAATLYEMKRYDEAETDWLSAIQILKAVGFHDGEIAVSLLMLAHLTFDRDGSSYEKIEALLDEAWDYINSDNQPKDGNYAYILRKCAPSLEYFKRPEEAQACRDVAKEIYYDRRE